MKIYSNLECKFTIFEISQTHAQMIIRSLKTPDRPYNIDILFKMVKNVVLPFDLKGIEISLYQENQGSSVIVKKYHFQNNKDCKIFSIRDADKNEYFVNAAVCGVFHNTMDILEHSIGRFPWTVKGDKIVWFDGEKISS